MILLLLLGVAPPAPSPYFVIRAVDDATGRGIPLVHLHTVDGTRLVTDSGGVAVYDEPGMMNRVIHFMVSSPGYELPADGFGFRGRMLTTTRGSSATLRLKRLNIAERLYRVTGAGIYRDSFMAARAYPIREPLLNAEVAGADSVLTAEYKGRIFWVWGDTTRPRYPLGNFHASGATSLPPGKGGLAPSAGVDLTYFTNKDGFAAEMCRMPGDGPTWITGLFTVEGRLVASYIKVKPPLTAYKRGLAVFDDAKQRFVHLADLPFDAKAHPTGHTMTHGGHIHFCHPFPLVRVKATLAAVKDAGAYEAYSGGAWKKGVAADRPDLKDRSTGKAVKAHHGSTMYNAYRKKWVLITVQQFGKASHLGEVWYAEADAPEGPWGEAVHVATHPKHDFYNPKWHPQFTESGGRYVYFEGTFTNTFSGNPDRVPRYEYNQLMYRLDLADPRLSSKRGR